MIINGGLPDGDIAELLVTHVEASGVTVAGRPPILTITYEPPSRDEPGGFTARIAVRPVGQSDRFAEALSTTPRDALVDLYLTVVG